MNTKRPVSSLCSLCLTTIMKNLPRYELDSLKYLPFRFKDKLLHYILIPKWKSWVDQNLHELFTILTHPYIKSVNLSFIKPDDDILSILRICRNLIEVNLRCHYSATAFTSNGLIELFQETPKLMKLNLSFCKQVTDNVLECLSIYCPNLKELNLEGCEEVTNEGFQFLAQKNDQIKFLTISNTKITGEGISEAIDCKNWTELQELRIDFCSDVTDKVLSKIIQNCPKIEILTFYNCPIEGDSTLFQEIAENCKTLKMLHWTVNWE